MLSEKISHLLKEFIAANEGRSPALIGLHPDTHVSLRRQVPTFSRDKGHYEFDGVEIFTTRTVPPTEVYLYPLPLKLYL